MECSFGGGFCVFFPDPADVFRRKIGQLWRFLPPKKCSFAIRAFCMTPGVHRGRCQRRISSNFLCNDVTCRYFDLPTSSEILVEMRWNFGSCRYVLKDFLIFLGPETARKGTNSSSKRNPQNSDSIYLFPYWKLAGKKGNTRMGFEALMGRMDPYFFVLPEKFVLWVYLSGNPLPWDESASSSPLTFLRPARRVCRHGKRDPDVSDVNTFFTQKRAQLYMAAFFGKIFGARPHQRVPFITFDFFMISFDFFCPQVFLSQKSKVIFFLWEGLPEFRKAKLEAYKKWRNLVRNGWSRCFFGKGSSLQGNQFLDVGKQCEAIDACTSQQSEIATQNRQRLVDWCRQSP